MYNRPQQGPALIDARLPVALYDGTPMKIAENHGDWFVTADGGSFDAFGGSLSGSHWRTPLVNVSPVGEA